MSGKPPGARVIHLRGSVVDPEGAGREHNETALASPNGSSSDVRLPDNVATPSSGEGPVTASQLHRQRSPGGSVTNPGALVGRYSGPPCVHTNHWGTVGHAN
jgi:hypothetical protein